MNANTRLAYLMALLVLLGFSGNASASDLAINSCGDECRDDCTGEPDADCQEAVGGVCKLFQDIHCTSGEDPILIKDNNTLDMNSHSIICDDNCAYDAIEFDSTGSKVINTHTSESTVEGDFVAGVDCNLKNPSTVEGITFLDVFIGVRDCKFIKNNVFDRESVVTALVNYGVVTDGVSTTGDQIHENYFRDRRIAIRVIGTDKVQIKDNVFDTTTRMGAVFQVDSDSEVKVNGNTVMGDGQTWFGLTSPKIFYTPGGQPTAELIQSGNKVVCSDDHPDCNTCQTDTYERCWDFLSPFLMEP